MSHFSDASGVVRLSDVQIPPSFFERISTGSSTLDVALGGEDLPGVMPATTWLVTGFPGAGKSTLLMQVIEYIASELGLNCLYSSGEESVERIALRAKRLGISGGSFAVGGFADFLSLENFIRDDHVDVCVVDSLQALVEGDEGKVHKTVKMFVRLAKQTGCTFFLVGHVTKGGIFSGKNSIEHDVDAHLSIRIDKDTGGRYAIVTKNRVGPSMIPYELSMSDSGLSVKELKESEGNKRDSDASLFLEEVKRLLLSGEKLSGYSHDEFESLRRFGRSGGFMRSMLNKAISELESKGFVVFRETINRREHMFIDAPETGMNV